MSNLLQAVLAVVGVLWCLHRLRSAHGAATYITIFVILFSLSIFLQVQSFYYWLTDVTGLNHIGWLTSYVSGTCALYACYRGLQMEMGGAENRRWLYHFTIITNVLLLGLYWEIMREPMGVNELRPYNFSTLFFRLITYFYTSVICFALLLTVYWYQKNELLLHFRIRWVVIFAIVIIAFFGFAIRIPYSISVFLVPSTPDTAIGQMIYRLIDILSLARVGWLFFFVPASVYRQLLRPFIFFDKLITLRQLEKLSRCIQNHVQFKVRLQVENSLVDRFRSIDFLIYRTVILIHDGKEKLSRIVVDSEPESYLYRLHDALDYSGDESDYDRVVNTFRQVSKRFA